MARNDAAVAYQRYMGRYSDPLAPQMADFAGIAAGQRALDVGSGPGALTDVLVARLGAEAVAAVDPSRAFLAAIRDRHAGVTLHQASAERLPFADAVFDASLAQLVVHFMGDPVTGLTEMRRVTRPGGVLAACVWDLAGGRAPISLVLQAIRETNGDPDDERKAAGARKGHLAALFEAVGLRDIEQATFMVRAEHATFADWWEPYTLDVAAGSRVADLEPALREEVRERCRARLGDGPFVITGYAWAARGVA